MRKHTTIAIILMASIFMLASNGMPFGQRAQKQRLAKDSVAMKDSAAVSDSMAIADNKSMPDTIGMVICYSLMPGDSFHGISREVYIS